MSTLVISGSAKDQTVVRKWVDYWTAEGYSVIDYPAPIAEGRFKAEYPAVFRTFFECLAACDVLFVMNEDRDDTSGYVGAATFAELSYGVARNACGHGPVDIVVLKPPGPGVHGVDEIVLWHDLGWLSYHSGG